MVKTGNIDPGAGSEARDRPEQLQHEPVQVVGSAPVELARPAVRIADLVIAEAEQVNGIPVQPEMIDPLLERSPIRRAQAPDRGADGVEHLPRP